MCIQRGDVSRGSPICAYVTQRRGIGLEAEAAEATTTPATVTGTAAARYDRNLITHQKRAKLRSAQKEQIARRENKQTHEIPPAVRFMLRRARTLHIPR